MSERTLVNSILIEFGSRPNLRLWRVNVGAAKWQDGLIRFGLPGMADISGIRLPSGQRIEIECKTPTGRQSLPQKHWQAMIERFGGLYILARNLDDVRRFLGDIK